MRDFRIIWINYQKISFQNVYLVLLLLPSGGNFLVIPPFREVTADITLYGHNWNYVII